MTPSTSPICLCVFWTHMRLCSDFETISAQHNPAQSVFTAELVVCLLWDACLSKRVNGSPSSPWGLSDFEWQQRAAGLKLAEHKQTPRFHLPRVWRATHTHSVTLYGPEWMRLGQHLRGTFELLKFWWFRNQRGSDAASSLSVAGHYASWNSFWEGWLLWPF